MPAEDMKLLVRQKLQGIVQCINNGRTFRMLEKVEETLEMMQQLSQLTDIESSLTCVSAAFTLLLQDVRQAVDDENAGEYDVCVPIEHGSKGRPKYSIPYSVISFLVENNFTVKDMAQLVMVSESTIKRRLKQYDLRIENTYSDISQSQLEKEVQKIAEEFPDVGYRTVSSILLAKGHRVQESRVREALRFADPNGVLFRRLFLSTCRMQRRTYNVRAPLALWHIDGNHKLIR